MKKVEFNRYVEEKIRAALPNFVAKNKSFMELAADVERATGTSLNKEDREKKVLKSLVNHFDKLVDCLKNTSEKKIQLNKNALHESERLTPMDQQFEVYKALLKFLEITSTRDKDGIRNAFVSFTRQRKQRYVRPTENTDGGRRGRPNLHRGENYRVIVNRAVKIQRLKAAQKIRSASSVQRIKEAKRIKVSVNSAAPRKRLGSSRSKK